MKWTRTKYHGRVAHRFEDWTIAAPSRRGGKYGIYRGGDRVGAASSLSGAKAEVARRNRPERVRPRQARVAKGRCAVKGRQPSRERDRMPSRAFALPALRAYPLYRMQGDKLIPSGSHAANAKARARQQLRAGNLTGAQYERIVAKADAVLAKCGARGAKPGQSSTLSAAMRRDSRR